MHNWKEASKTRGEALIDKTIHHSIQPRPLAPDALLLLGCRWAAFMIARMITRGPPQASGSHEKSYQPIK
jgi:hypothetical protein